MGSDASLAVDASHVSAAHLLADPGQLRRMVRNLLDNGARHAHAKIVVTLAEIGDGCVRFSVADDGDGIASSDAERIFERFVRLDQARSRDRGGTGLGLAITRDIVVRHGGTIAVAVDRSAGAEFVVTLPVTDGDVRRP